MDTLFRVEMLGRFAVRQGSREITRFRTQKTASLLACLALNRSRTHPRDVLIEQFWPDSELKAARTNLSVALNALRRQLEPPGVPSGAVLIADHSQVRLNPIAFTTDVEDFHTAVRAAELETDTAKRLALGMTALDLYCGDLLPGYYEDWILRERDRWREMYLTMLRHTVAACSASEQMERAIEYAYRLVQADPLREDSHGLLIGLFLEAGRPHEALHQYQELERLLSQELQTEPSEATRTLAAQLRDLPFPRRKVVEATVSETPRNDVVPEVPAAPVESLRVPHRVPHLFTRFFGREEEIARLVALLKPENPSACPLVTLTGAGGTGKTRLSIEVAECLTSDFMGGIWFVPMAEVTDPRHLGEVLRDALELPRHNQKPALEQVIAYLGERPGPCLLLLDNFEQIATGGASVLWTLLSRVRSLRCLVTSRQPLALPGEREFPVAPLPIPTGSNAVAISERETHPISPYELLTCPSVALFVDRAQAARPEFQITERNAEAVAAICEKLEGIPLAIELAAARARALTPGQILERLTERFELLASQRADKGERHRSLWAAIDWSYHLLSPELQRLFARLSVFRGGWTLEAAEAVVGGLGSGVGGLSGSGAQRAPRGPGSEGRWSVDSGRWSSDEEEDTRIAGRLTSQHSTPNTQYSMTFPRTPDPGPRTPALDGLTQLRGHSLILVEESSVTIRFRMLETLREFAEEQLDPVERAEMAQRHTTYFQQWVKAAIPIGPEQANCFAKFEEDQDNLRAALERAESAPTDIALELATGLTRFWLVRGYLAEGRRWLESGLERPNISEALRARTMDAAGVLAYRQGDSAVARNFHEKSKAIWQTLGDKEGLSTSLSHLGNIAGDQSDYALACALYEESLDLQRERKDHWSIATSLYNLARMALCQSEYARARPLYEESLTIRREIGDTNGVAYCLHGLGLIADNLGDYEQAQPLYEESLTKFREAGDRAGIASVLADLGDVARVQEDFTAARAFYQESLTILREVGDNWRMGVVLNSLGLLESAQGNYEKAKALYEESLALKRQMGGRQGIAYSLFYLGQLAFQQGDYATARTHYRESLSLRNELNGNDGILDSLEGFAQLAAAEGDWERAARLFGAIETLVEALGLTLSPRMQTQRAAQAAQIQEALGRETYDAAMAAGKRMTREQVIAYALG